MALYPVTGSPSLKSEPLPSSDGLIRSDSGFDETLLKHGYTKDTYNLRTALNRSRLNPIIEKLSNFGAGYPIRVTYYSNNLNYTNKKTNVDYSEVLNNVHKSYKKILNLELRLTSEMSYSYNDDLSEATIEGSGKIYPGFTPNVGDIFLYEILPGQIGLFVITNVTPLALYSKAFHETSFMIREFVTNERIQQIEQCVIENYFYSTVTTLGEVRVLLNRTDYINLQNLLQTRKVLIELFHYKFFKNTMKTYLRTDDVYDPYVVDFMRKNMSYDDHPDYPPTQLVYNKTLKYSIWDMLSDCHTELERIRINKANKVQVTFGPMSAKINGLINKQRLVLDPEGENFYAFSEAFYNKDVPNMDTYESALYNFITSKMVDTSAVTSLIESNNEDDKLFYFIPAVICMINYAVHSLDIR